MTQRINSNNSIKITPDSKGADFRAPKISTEKVPQGPDLFVGNSKPEPTLRSSSSNVGAQKVSFWAARQQPVTTSSATASSATVLAFQEALIVDGDKVNFELQTSDGVKVCVDLVDFFKNKKIIPADASHISITIEKIPFNYADEIKPTEVNALLVSYHNGGDIYEKVPFDGTGSPFTSVKQLNDFLQPGLMFVESMDPHIDEQTHIDELMGKVSFNTNSPRAAGATGGMTDLNEVLAAIQKAGKNKDALITALSSVMSRQSATTLIEAITDMAELPGFKFNFEAGADATGSQAANLKITHARAMLAAAVAATLEPEAFAYLTSTDTGMTSDGLLPNEQLNTLPSGIQEDRHIFGLGASDLVDSANPTSPKNRFIRVVVDVSSPLDSKTSFTFHADSVASFGFVTIDTAVVVNDSKEKKKQLEQYAAIYLALEKKIIADEVTQEETAQEETALLIKQLQELSSTVAREFPGSPLDVTIAAQLTINLPANRVVLDKFKNAVANRVDFDSLLKDDQARINGLLRNYLIADKRDRAAVANQMAAVIGSDTYNDTETRCIARAMISSNLFPKDKKFNRVFEDLLNNPRKFKSAP